VTDTLERKVGALTVRIDRTTCIDDVGIIEFREPPTDVSPDVAVEACGVCPVDALAAFPEDGRPL
jgi:autonomous glycyl radical cofactor GrcA